jgi:2-polyprenyl-3-methyl-5-hydroxy-6-metoxy-1,4-benzoquinol methylase
MAEALHGTHFPILDLGCGLGIWSFYLRACGYTAPILGLDFDARKITAAQAAAQRAGQTLEFAVADVSQGLPAHAGHVTILDILQYFPAPIRSELLRAAAQRVAPGAKLLIRSGVRDHSWRFRLTHLADRFARMIRWMKSPPIDYCTQAGLLEILHAEGLVGGARPLWGNTPFNNYLFVLERPWA